MRLLYFASVRETVGRAEEERMPPPGIGTVGDLLGWLRGLGPEYAAALSDATGVRVALDKVHARPEEPVGSAAEAAFFPPMTGG